MESKSLRQGGGKTLSQLKKRVKKEVVKSRRKNSIKKILVPLDGSKDSFKGLTYAIDLALSCNAKVFGAYVIPYYPEYWAFLKPPSEKTLLKEGKKTLDQAKKICEKNGINFSSKILHGENAGKRIMSFAANHKYDLIVMGSIGKGSLKRLILGSISNYVVHRSKVPVTIVH